MGFRAACVRDYVTRHTKARERRFALRFSPAPIGTDRADVVFGAGITVLLTEGNRGQQVYGALQMHGKGDRINSGDLIVAARADGITPEPADISKAGKYLAATAAYAMLWILPAVVLAAIVTCLAIGLGWYWSALSCVAR